MRETKDNVNESFNNANGYKYFGSPFLVSLRQRFWKMADKGHNGNHTFKFTFHKRTRRERVT